MKYNKPAVDLNDLLKNTYAKDVIEKWLNSDYDRYNLENFEEKPNNFTIPWLVLDKTHLKSKTTLTHSANMQFKQDKWKISILAYVQSYWYVKICYFTKKNENAL